MVIGFTAGAFDLLHAGHCLMLAQAKEKCDYLIVGLHSNPNIQRPWKNFPVQSILERFIQLKSSPFVNEIVPYSTEDDLLVILNNFKIDVRFVGEEYKAEHHINCKPCCARNKWSHHNCSNSLFGITLFGIKWKKKPECLRVHKKCQCAQAGTCFKTSACHAVF